MPDIKKIIIVSDTETWGLGRQIGQFFAKNGWQTEQITRLIDVPSDFPGTVLVIGWFDLHSTVIDTFPRYLPKNLVYLQSTMEEGIPTKAGIKIIRNMTLASDIFKEVTAEA